MCINVNEIVTYAISGFPLLDDDLVRGDVSIFFGALM